MLKFVKILTYDVKRDEINCIIETRSLSLEYLSLQKLRKVYDDFLKSFPTTLEQDMKTLRDQEKLTSLTCRQYFAVIYRTEQKRILINQIKLINILMHILERLMRGMTLEFATGRVFEFEEKRDVQVNRLMVDNYLRSLQRGLDKNVADYYKSKNLDTQTGPEVLKQISRDLKDEMSAI